MRISLAGFWQLSPLTDLSIPQEDLCFPAPLSQALPHDMTEVQIAEQEWHLMHDVEVDEAMLSFAAIDLVLEGIDFYAEIRLNGVALFDCDGSQAVYKKDIRPLLQLGRNRFEILFVEQEEEWLLDEPDLPQLCPLGHHAVKKYDERMGIWQEPYLQCIRHVRLEHVTAEQIWHYGGGCEFLVHLHYQTYAPGLVSAVVKFNGMSYQLPIDVRHQHASALFQVEAPKYADLTQLNPNDLYTLSVQLDGQQQSFHIALSEDLCVTHFPI
ncbi:MULTISPECIES: glycosyl hydrolase 2 galactose-binding domain-containing protein [unclassified Vibrio]|uniref:glycosyl hydrolase 2 galactose-binding domain-containing protein n=1 Tax=unclassified Vibrio TaxID=2614977 RepID=UPI000B8EB480|nr:MULTISPECIES: hypothetical protein [unclassified Vibrio]NAX45061.1 hypothetical protein [Vibrio sp. V25_P4S6T154]OXX43581.1 beta-galactosidase [Vibrio sp. V17_P4S1T151]OXX62084.1 beta-galactosidase [Vibrio sp. V15_P4S5T153]OXX67342.1 beta-galactosidase [Vibrio sp. V19_P1S1T109]OXX69007.1 beta-galactosidase [Vibrio sp. V20_P4S3T152]